VSLFWLWLYAYSILYNMAFMWWCSILGPGRILLLLIACFITFYVHRVLQQKQQHQCIIYCMCCRSLLSENSEQIRIRFEYRICKSNLSSNFKTKVQKFELCSTFLVVFVCLQWAVVSLTLLLSIHVFVVTITSSSLCRTLNMTDFR